MKYAGLICVLCLGFFLYTGCGKAINNVENVGEGISDSNGEISADGAAWTVSMGFEPNKDSLYFALDRVTDEKDLLVRVFFREEDAYLFLPGYTKSNRFVVKETFSKDITIDGKNISDGKGILLNEGEYELKIGKKKYSFHVMKSANVPAAFIISDSDISVLCIEEKGTALSGTICFVDTNGTFSQAEVEKMDGRGNTTWGAGFLFFGKLPYNIKLKEATNVLGIASNKKWALLANAFDESLMRNILADDMGQLCKMEKTPQSRNVDLYFNGEYLGTYQISQRVNVGKNSLVDIFDLEKENERMNDSLKETVTVEVLDAINGNGSSGSPNGSYIYSDGVKTPKNYQYGYLLEFDFDSRYREEGCGFVTEHGQPVVIKSPSVCSREEVLFIKSYIQRVEDAIYSEDGTNQNGEHYSDLIDIDSFAKYFLISEALLNTDAIKTSCFMYLDKGEKLRAGPLWDFDIAMGGCSEALPLLNLWCVKDMNIPDKDCKCMYAALCMHNEFWERVKLLWNESLSDNMQKIIDRVDVYYDMFLPSARMNFARYDVLTHEPVWMSAETGTTYEENIVYLKKILTDRKDFLDDYFK